MSIILRDTQEKHPWFGDGSRAKAGGRFISPAGFEVWDVSLEFGDYASSGKVIERKSIVDLANCLQDRVFQSRLRRSGQRSLPTEWDALLFRTTQAVMWLGRPNFRIVVEGVPGDLLQVFPKMRLGKPVLECKLHILQSIADVIWAGTVENAEREALKFLLGR